MPATNGTGRETISMKTLCVILARSGSKGLPGKNTLVVAGRPMVAWTIDHAHQAKCVERIVVSTDSPAVAGVAHDHGLDVIGRPAELATDTATVDSAVRHAVTCTQQQHDQMFDAVVILYGNVPVRPIGLVDRAIQKLKASGADSVQSICPVGKFHPYWMQTLAQDRGDVIEPFQAHDGVYRRQDLPAVYQLDGGVIAVTCRSLFTVEPGRPHAFLGSDRRAVVTQPGEVVDVDTRHDLFVAQAMLSQEVAGRWGANGRDRR